MPKLWFAAKRYGYGWYPSSIEGWLVILIFLLAIVLPIPMSEFSGGKSPDDTFAYYYLPYAFVLVVILLWICVKKGEKARWRWGKD